MKLVSDIMSSSFEAVGGSGAVHLHAHGLVEDMAEVVEMVNIRGLSCDQWGASGTNFRKGCRCRL